MTKSEFFSAAGKWATGLNTHAASLGLTNFSGTILQSHLGNAQQTELVFQASRSATLAASNTVLTARGTALLYAEKARTALKTFLGERWSTAWTQAGFINHTLVLPKNTPGVLSLLRALQTHFTNNTVQQNATAGVTAAAAGALVTPLDNGGKALNTAKCAQRTKRDAREASEKTVRDYLRNSRKAVEALLPAGDPRWLDFVDAVPGDLRAPEAVSALDTQPGVAGHLSVHWLDSLRAAWFVLAAAVGNETAFTPVATVHDTVADLEFPPGASVRLRVRARNAAGASGPSAVVQAVVPAALAA